jgi:TonB family protein
MPDRESTSSKRPSANGSAASTPDGVRGLARVFVGRIRAVGVAEIVRSLRLEGASATVLLDAAPAGRLRFEDGEIVEAECGALRGTAALYELLRIDQGSFRVEVEATAAREAVDARAEWPAASGFLSSAEDPAPLLDLRGSAARGRDSMPRRALRRTALLAAAAIVAAIAVGLLPSSIREMDLHELIERHGRAEAEYREMALRNTRDRARIANLQRMTSELSSSIANARTDSPDPSVSSITEAPVGGALQESASWRGAPVSEVHLRVDVPPSLTRVGPNVRAFVDRRDRALRLVLPWTDRRRFVGGAAAATVDVRVSASGAVEQAYVLRSSGYPDLDRAALAAIRAGLYAPALRDGSPTPGRILQLVTFQAD